ncbi:DUF1904 family protein [Paenibacillus sp. chi10]|uniref:DUF1904 family protein n=1 Tax=Paenibacillus suaedae TaxID=3077233 RepID=A0AAJ2N2L3_9BACL|nr:DUF1904 family protein [Paenibacillus sp. chi10]MDT8977698.1 DUF1904 family protein [Paenibacillus sp. chi10]
MPYIRFKTFPDAFVEEIAPDIVKEFASIVRVEQEKVKIEVLNVHIITNTPLSVEIMMFQRDKETHDAVAASIDHMLRERGYPGVHIFFIILDPHYYYKEGKPLR